VSINLSQLVTNSLLVHDPLPISSQKLFAWVMNESYGLEWIVGSSQEAKVYEVFSE
jgi:hypothetical protein